MERLGECVEEAETRGDDKHIASADHSRVAQELLASKEEELGQIQRALASRTTEVEAALKENQAKDALLRDQGISMSSLEEVNRSLADQLAAQEERASSLAAELDSSRLENASLRKKLDNFNLKIDTVRSLEADFDALNQDFTKVSRMSRL